MTTETAQTLLRQIFNPGYSSAEITFSFQGTEPTLAGIEFYQEFVKAAQWMCPAGCHLFWAIKTRTADLDDEWCNLFLQHDFEVSVEIDGTHPRRNSSMWSKIRPGFRKLIQWDVSVNADCVISNSSPLRPETLYDSLKKLGAKNISFIPSLNAGSEESADAMTPPQLANLMCRTFDVWYDDWTKGMYRFVNPFDDYIRIIRGLDCRECAVRGRCGDTVLVKANGSVYPCEKFQSEAYRIGLIGEGGIKEALRSSRYQQWLQSGSQKPKECLDCTRRALCNGGCKGEWVAAEDGMHNPYCSAYKRFFLYTYSRLIQIARETKTI